MGKVWFKEVRGCRGVSDTCWRVVHFFFALGLGLAWWYRVFSLEMRNFGFWAAVGGGCALLASDGLVMAAH